MRHVIGLTLKPIGLINKKKDHRTALPDDDAEKVTLQNFAVKGATYLPVLSFSDTKPLIMKKANVPGERKSSTNY